MTLDLIFGFFGRKYKIISGLEIIFLAQILTLYSVKNVIKFHFSKKKWFFAFFSTKNHSNRQSGCGFGFSMKFYVKISGVGIKKKFFLGEFATLVLEEKSWNFSKKRNFLNFHRVRIWDFFAFTQKSGSYFPRSIL